MSKIDKRLWGVLGKQQTYYSPQQFLKGKTKVPLNANPLDSWDVKRSRFYRVDGYENAIQQGGVVPQQTSPATSPTPTPSVTPTYTPIVDCYWNTNNDNWENDSTLWNDCVNVPTPSPTPTNTTTPTNTPTQTTTPTNTPTQTNTPTNTSTSTPTPSITPSAVASGTSEANAFLAAVLATGGTFGSSGSTISAATVTLFTDLVSNSLWDKVIAFYPFIGGIAASTAINGKTPGTFNMSWNGGVTFDSNGPKGNGTNGYGDTGVNDSLHLGLNNAHFSIYSQTNSLDNGADFGVIDGPNTSSFQAFIKDAGGDYYARIHDNTYMTAANADSTGYYVWTRTASNARRIYKNGGNLANDTTASVGLANDTITIFARNRDGFAPDNFNSRRFGFVSVGSGLTTTEMGTLSTIVNTFATSLNRNTY
jgi:hypothetical protein